MMHANKQQNHARHQVGFIRALIILISAASLATGPIRESSAQADARSWSYTGSLNTARAFHTATLLHDGKVLVAGGYPVDDPFLASAELYDPTTGTWSFTGSLNGPRAVFTATLLKDGKVLIVGGIHAGSFDSVLNSAELYDPDTGTWSVTGSLNTPRSNHTATLLQNGKVLVTGGYDGKAYLRAAELYDPDTGAWSFTGDLNGTLSHHTATLLQNGRVLASLGERRAELYDPDNETWSSVDRRNASYRLSHTSTLLPDGRVLCVGGFYYDQFEDPVIYDTAELYNPNTGQWSSTGLLNSARNGHTATLLTGGKVLVMGSSGYYTGFSIGTAELYDPEKGTWSFTSTPNNPRSDHTVTLLRDGKVLIVGGSGGSPGNFSILDSAELGHNLAAVHPTIIMASLAGKKLIVRGEYFVRGAVILINGKERETVNDSQNPHTTLTSKKAGKKIRAGDRVQVRNPDGTLSAEFIFTGS
jgi:N-acetylneuraminic acid mutarotase